MVELSVDSSDGLADVETDVGHWVFRESQQMWQADVVNDTSVDHILNQIN